MANLNPEAIRGAIIENLDGTVSGPRQLLVGEADADIHEGASDEMKALRALVRPRFTVNITEMKTSEGSPMGHTTLRLYDVTIVVRAVYNLQGPGVDHVDYQDRKAVAEAHADKFMQRLSWPGSLTNCISLGKPTGIVSGMLRSKDLYRVTRDDPEKSIFEVEQTYAAIVRVDAAIS